MRRAIVAAVVLLALAVVICPSCDSDGAATKEEPKPYADYPDADIVIAEDDKGSVVAYYKVSDAAGTDPAKYDTKSVRSGGDLRLVSISGADGSLDIVMVSGKLGTLTLVYIDKLTDVTLDVDFTMVSGTVTRLQGTAMSSSLASTLPASYYQAYAPIGSMDLTVRGAVGSLVPSSELVGMEDLSITIADGAAVDRLYPTGENGRYEDVTVTMTGGSVGYMSNQKAVVTNLTYDLRVGSIDYLCLGADTEGGTGYYRSYMWTFYVMKDVSIRIGPFVTVGKAIMGAGITDAPSVLCNGQDPAVPTPRSASVDSSVGITADRCFLDGGDKAFRFSTYTIGGKLQSSALRTSYYVSYQTHPVYGDGGIWASPSGVTVRTGTMLRCDTELTVPSGAELRVESGGILANTVDIIVYGSMVNEGTVRNNGLIEKRGGGTYEGTSEGTGHIAVCVYARPTDGRVDVMAAEGSAVVMRSQSGEIYFNTASVYFSESKARVVVSAPESMFIGGEYFVVSVDTFEQDGFDQAWVVYTSGFETYASGSMTVTLTSPAKISGGHAAQVFDSQGNAMEITSDSKTEVTFAVTGNGAYYFRTVASSDDEQGVGFLSGTRLNIAMAAAIVVVASIVVYLLLRRD